jgi:hypothetical protein
MRNCASPISISVECRFSGTTRRMLRPHFAVPLRWTSHDRMCTTGWRAFITLWETKKLCIGNFNGSVICTKRTTTNSSRRCLLSRRDRLCLSRNKRAIGFTKLAHFSPRVSFRRLLCEGFAVFFCPCTISRDSLQGRSPFRSTGAGPFHFGFRHTGARFCLQARADENNSARILRLAVCVVRGLIASILGLA